MNWCVIGFHDYVTQSASELVELAYHRILSDRGFMLTGSETISGKPLPVPAFQKWRRADGVSFVDTQMGWYPDPIRPEHAEDHVCIRCGKIKRSYDLKIMERKIDQSITRKHKAQDIISRENSHDSQ